MGIDLSIEFCGISFKNPLVLSSGPLTENGEMLKEAGKMGVGAVMTRALHFHKGNPLQWIPCSPGSLLNKGGTSPLGIEAWIDTEIQIAKKGGVPVFGVFENPHQNIEEVKKMASGLTEAGVDVLVLIDPGSPQAIHESIQAVKQVSDLPIALKIGIGDWGWLSAKHLHKLGEVATNANADAIVAIDTIASASKINFETLKSIPSGLNDCGWSLSGTAIHPLAAFCVSKLARSTDLPILGVGGVSTGIDAAEMILLGATCVGICTAAVIDGLEIFPKVLKNLEAILNRHGFKTIRDCIGYSLEST